MTTAEAAKQLGVNSSLVRKWCVEGRIKASQMGRNWWIEPADLEDFRNKPRKPGQPSKKKTEAPS